MSVPSSLACDRVSSDLSRNRRRRRFFREAEQWIENTDGSWVFSFEHICEVLRLDSDYLRRGLRVWKERAQDLPHALVIALQARREQESGHGLQVSVG